MAPIIHALASYARDVSRLSASTTTTEATYYPAIKSLGGYPVIKKWLGYREARRRDGKPLTLPEKDHLRSLVQRLAALAVLEPLLDRIYSDVAADAFTAEELGI